MTKQIWLCGFMGCGKSTVGALLAQACKTQFLDMDAVIEEEESMRIPKIFSEYGEPHFRALEAAYVKRLGSLSEAVIAAGGGAFLSPANAAEAKKNGVIVFLDVPFEACYARIARTDRPIVKQNTKAGLQEIYKKRYPLYCAHADLRIEAETAPEETAKKILRKLQAFIAEK